MKLKTVLFATPLDGATLNEAVSVVDAIVALAVFDGVDSPAELDAVT